MCDLKISCKKANVKPTTLFGQQTTDATKKSVIFLVSKRRFCACGRFVARSASDT